MLRSHPGPPPAASLDRSPRRALLAACTAHAVHDGLTDFLYVLLPLWQAQFAIPYALVGLLRGLYSGTMATAQLAVGRAARRWGSRRLLVGGTVLAGGAYLLMGALPALAPGLSGLANTTLPLLMGILVLGGLGASTQHPLASAQLADAWEARGEKAVASALARYNFAGDVGKALLPALGGLCITGLGWPPTAQVLGGIALVAALILAALLAPPGKGTKVAEVAQTTPLAPAPLATTPYSKPPPAAAHLAARRRGARALLATGIIDSAVRMGFLTFLPFLLQGKGADPATQGLALALLFVGGGFGKLLCGALGARLGLLATVWLTEGFTALAMVAALALPLLPCLLLLPLLGVALNGTSSVLYGAVATLAPPGQRERAFAHFYTGTIGSGALSPILFGLLGDRIGLPTALCVLAGLVLLTLPSAWQVRAGLGATEAP